MLETTPFVTIQTNPKCPNIILPRQWSQLLHMGNRNWIENLLTILKQICTFSFFMPTLLTI